MTKYPPGKRKATDVPITTRSNSKENPSSLLLRILLKGSPYYVSGSIIAEKLKMSRVGVWARIAKLRKAGLTIEASQNRGYRIAAEPDIFNQHLMEAWLHEIKIKCKVFVSQRIDSTNSEAERHLTNQAKTPFAVVSNEQHAGRGRLGRTWYSPKTGNINLTIAFRPKIRLIKLKIFTLWQGIAIVELLRKKTGNNSISIKWPNDIYVKQKKLGGILLEMIGDPAGHCSVIVGVGLNVSMPASQADAIDQDWTDVTAELESQQATGADPVLPARNQLAAALISEILPLLSTFQTQGFAAYRDEWQAADAFYGQAAAISTPKQAIAGVVRGVDANGALRLELDSGKIESFIGGELSLRLAE